MRQKDDIIQLVALGTNVFESQTAPFLVVSWVRFPNCNDSFASHWYLVTLPSVLVVKTPGRYL